MIINQSLTHSINLQTRLLKNYHINFLHYKHIGKYTCISGNIGGTDTSVGYLSVNDIDECSTGKHNCSHICSNTYGGFDCSCYQGYTLLADKSTCQGKINYDWFANLGNAKSCVKSSYFKTVKGRFSMTRTITQNLYRISCLLYTSPSPRDS